MYPGLGFAGSGRWTMQIVTDTPGATCWTAWRSRAATPILCPALCGLAVLAPGDEHLNYGRHGLRRKRPLGRGGACLGQLDGPPVSAGTPALWPPYAAIRPHLHPATRRLDPHTTASAVRLREGVNVKVVRKT